MWFYGKNPLKEALKSGKPIEKIFVSKNTILDSELKVLLKKQGVLIHRVPKIKIDQLTGTSKNQGIAFRISVIGFVSQKEIIEKVIKEKGILLAMDRVQDPQNVGNIIRTAYAFGVSGIVVTTKESVAFTETVAKASAGTVFHIPIARTGNLKRFLEDFKKRGGVVFALETGGENILNKKMAFPMALVVGSEGKGIKPGILKVADEIVTIPMSGDIASINVASATAIALFKAYSEKIKMEEKNERGSR